jgi:hypothetical protein
MTEQQALDVCEQVDPNATIAGCTTDPETTPFSANEIRLTFLNGRLTVLQYVIDSPAEAGLGPYLATFRPAKNPRRRRQLRLSVHLRRAELPRQRGSVSDAPVPARRPHHDDANLGHHRPHRPAELLVRPRPRRGPARHLHHAVSAQLSETI